MNSYLPTCPEIHILGRTKMQNPLPLFWTGSGLELRTDSMQLWFELESDYTDREEWIRIEVDGFCLQRMMVPGDRSSSLSGWRLRWLHSLRSCAG